MIEMEGHEMNFSAWEQKAANFKVRVQDLSRRYDELNAYCQGTFDEEEYNRRLAYCDSMASQLDTLRNQTAPEAEAIDAERIELQARETRRAEAARAMFERLAQYVERMVLACIDLPPAEAGRCRIPLAPGPRTRDMVDTLNANLTGDFP